jgi:hypothetical protein
MTNDVSWLVGLEKYFRFVNQVEQAQFVKHISSLFYTSQLDKPWTLKHLIADDYENFTSSNRNLRSAFYVKLFNATELSAKEFLDTMKSIWPSDIFIDNLIKLNNINDRILQTVFAKSQVLSKIWLSEILEKNETTFDHILLLGGWLTQHTLYFRNIKYNKLFSIDMDKETNTLAKILNPFAVILDNDCNSCFDESNNIVIMDKVLEPDLIINTSAEHMADDWFHKLKPGTRVIVQSNDTALEDHINYCRDFNDFLRKYPVDTVIYRGELVMSKYTRFMLYGIK